MARANRCLPSAFATPFPQKRTTSSETADSSWWTHHGEHGTGGAGHQLGHRVEEMSSVPSQQFGPRTYIWLVRGIPYLYDKRAELFGARSPLLGSAADNLRFLPRARNLERSEIFGLCNPNICRQSTAVCLVYPMLNGLITPLDRLGDEEEIKRAFTQT